MGSAPPFDGPPPSALIVPHAGYLYSGPVAAAAYAASPRVSRVVLVGPAHFVPCEGMVLPGVGAMRTSLGDVPVDTEGEELLGRHAVVGVDARAHAPEHSLEVQLPFLQVLCPGFRVLPLLTGRVSYREAAEVIGSHLGDEATLVVVSSDLSHYLDYESARRRDERTAAAIVAGRPEALHHGDACGLTGIRALVAAAAQRGMGARCLDVRNSGDTAGPRDRVVGYGAFAIG